jgi:hypothetical protein
MTSNVFQGYLALGYLTYGVGAPTFTEVSGGSYARQALNFTGSYSGGLSETSASIAAATSPAGQAITMGAIYNTSTGGVLIASFPLVTQGTVGTAYTLGAFSVQLESGLWGDFQDSGAVIQLGNVIGTANGQPLVAGSQLTVENGNIIPLAGFYNGEGLIDLPLGAKLVVRVNGINVLSIDGNGAMIISGTLTQSGSPG